MTIPIGPVLSHVTASAVREVLARAVASPRAMTHSWLFTGPPGSGRTVAARAFAAALVCPDGGCGRCDQCRMVMDGTHPDLVWWATDGATLTKDEADHVVMQAAALPTVGHWRVIVVEEADKLNESAANGLLKSVEEPPARTVFILCAPSTDPRDIAITLRSRCRHLYIPMPSIAEVEQVLLGDVSLGITTEQAAWAAAVSGGHVGRAKRLARDERARKKRDAALALPRLVYESSAAYRYTSRLVAESEKEATGATEERDQRERAELESALGIGAKGRGVAGAQRGSKGQLDELEKKQKARRKQLTLDFLDLALIDIAGLYRDAMMQAAGAMKTAEEPVGGYQHPDAKGLSAELARRNSAEALVRCMDAVSECREVLRRQVKPEIALNAMVGKLQQHCRVAR